MTTEYEIIGLTIDQALKVVIPHGIKTIRPTIVDGSLQAVTKDYRTDRLNVGIDDGKITSVGRLG